MARGIRVVRFTGSEVWADADRCARELLDVVRESQARPLDIGSDYHREQ
jgi:very-short-patch-repair endonuclease